MQGTSLTSHCVETGLVVSGVEATSMMSTPPLISSLATSAARLALDWLSFTCTSTGYLVRPILMPPFTVLRKFAMMKLSASAKPASGPVCGLT